MTQPRRLPPRPLEREPDRGTGRLRYQAMPAATYYIAQGEAGVWRIHDCVMVDGALRRVELEHPRATYRVFVGRPDTGGVRKLYRFRPREIRKLSPAACERQLLESEFLGVSGAFDSISRSAR